MTGLALSLSRENHIFCITVTIDSRITLIYTTHLKDIIFGIPYIILKAIEEALV